MYNYADISYLILVYPEIARAGIPPRDAGVCCRVILGKKKSADTDELVAGILDSQDCDIVVVRPKDSRILFLNKNARKRLPDGPRSGGDNDYAGLFPDIFDHIQGGKLGGDYPHSFDTEDDAGNIYEVTVNTLHWTDGKAAAIFFLRDVTEARTAHVRLYDLAYRDPLTGMPNRRRLKEDLEALEREIAMGHQAGVVGIIDLDNFKTVNDTYGHSTGDFMLRALTDHFQGDPDYKDHIYRLGGDEFALLYTERTARPDARTYYEELLKGALLAYSMPNIDITCTISMGIAFFPQHGDNYSDLLRKADIALYQAKNAGRNQIAFFEDDLDNAKKFRDVYIGIQPILDAKGQTFGYELIDNGTGEEDDSDVVNLGELNRTIDTLGLDDLSSDTKYLIAYTKQMLGSPPPVHLRRKFIIELHIPPEITAKELEDYQRLREYGFKIAVSGLGADNFTSEMLDLGDYIKLYPDALSESMQQKLIRGMPNKVFIAAGIDTPFQFDAAKKIGYTLFQGFYFNEARPVTTTTKDIEPIKVNYFRLLQLTATDDYVDFNEISQVISSDLALSYKLLKLLNSAALALPNRISSISMAVAYLGEEQIKKWISLLGLRGIAPGKPLELVRMSLIRARFGELLAPRFKVRRDARHVFLTGMLSLLGVALDKSMEDVLTEMPIHEDIAQSLLTKTGPHSDLVAFYRSYEYANWDDVSQFIAANGLTGQMVNDSYVTAVKWANELIDAY